MVRRISFVTFLSLAISTVIVIGGAQAARACNEPALALPGTANPSDTVRFSVTNTEPGASWSLSVEGSRVASGTDGTDDAGFVGSFRMPDFDSTQTVYVTVTVTHSDGTYPLSGAVQVQVPSGGGSPGSGSGGGGSGSHEAAGGGSEGSGDQASAASGSGVSGQASSGANHTNSARTSNAGASAHRQAARGHRAARQAHEVGAPAAVDHSQAIREMVLPPAPAAHRLSSALEIAAALLVLLLIAGLGVVGVRRIRRKGVGPGAGDAAQAARDAEWADALVEAELQEMIAEVIREEARS